MSESSRPHSMSRAINGLRAGINGFVPHPNDKLMHEDLDSLEEQLEAERRRADENTRLAENHYARAKRAEEQFEALHRAVDTYLTAWYSGDDANVERAMLRAAFDRASNPASSPPDLERRFRLADYGQPPVEPDPASKPYVRPAEDPHTLVAKALAPDPASSPDLGGARYVNGKWEPQCPYGDMCSRCDAIGYCERAESRPASEPPAPDPRLAKHLTADGTWDPASEPEDVVR